MPQEPASEQQENLELDAEPKPLEDPVSWRVTDPDRAVEPDSEAAAEQVSAPDRSNELIDAEGTEIGEDRGRNRPAGGAEQQALRVEDGEV